MKAPHLSQNPMADTSASGLMGAIGNNANLDPETLALLQVESLEKGVDFEQVLAASQKGHDPEAVIELLAKDSQTSDSQNPKQQAPQKSVENVLVKNPQDINVESKNTESTTTETTEGNLAVRNIFNGSQKNPQVASQVSQSETEANTKMPNPYGKRKSIFNVAPQAKVTTINTNTSMPKAMSAAGMGLYAQSKMGSPEQTNMQMAAQTEAVAVTNKPMQVAGQEATNEKSGKLLNLNEFMLKQSPTVKMNAAKSAYKPMNKSMFNKKIENSLQGVITKPSNDMKVQDMILAQTNGESGEQLSSQFGNQLNQNMAKGTEQSAAVGKVLDINQLQGTQSTEEVISKIQDYIIQTKHGAQAKVELSFEHRELGQVHLQVQKTDGDQLNIQIGSNQQAGMDFFTKNQGELLAKLAQAGIQVGDFKIDSSSNSSNQNLSDNSKQQQFGQEGKGQHNSQSGQRDSDSRRREELWNQFSEKDVA